jgi:hypothetical protein
VSNVEAYRASWFETRVALLTMRVLDLILRSIAKAMRLEG